MYMLRQIGSSLSCYKTSLIPFYTTKAFVLLDHIHFIPIQISIKHETPLLYHLIFILDLNDLNNINPMRSPSKIED